MSKKPINKRKALDNLDAQLDKERQSFMSHWKELSDFILPRRARFTLSDVNSGEKKNQNIIDGTASFANRTLKAGLTAGITSPARPWFNMSLEGKYDVEFGPDKAWLSSVTRTMHDALRKTNFYQTAPMLYGDIAVFGTGAIYVEEDFDKVARFYSIPIGSYKIANDYKLQVRTFIRDLSMTVDQIVKKFGLNKITNKIDWSNISDYIKEAYERGDLNTWISIKHAIRENALYDPRKLESKYKRYESIYYEPGVVVGNSSRPKSYGGADFDSFLQHKGYDYWPVLTPRWETTGSDAWGTDCPGMTALGDVKQLQKTHRRKSEIIDKHARPPMTGSSSLKSSKASILPGDITFLDNSRGTTPFFKPAYQTDGRIDTLSAEIKDIQARISTAFYEDLFLMLAKSDRRDITATEIVEKKEEKLIAMGSTYDRLNEDFLDPAVEIFFYLMNKQKRLPPPPPEIEGANLKINYTSIMAQAQKSIGIANLERFSRFAIDMANQTQKPELLDKVNFDQLIDLYGDRVSVEPEAVNSDEVVMAIRQNRADAQAAAQKQEQIAQMAGVAKDLGEVDMDKNTAYKQMVEKAGRGGV